MAYTLDPAHSTLGFSVRHMMIAKVRGTFGKFTADLDLDPKDLTKTKVKASVETASIDTGVADRDGHLRSGDFFDAENHPTMTFVSKDVQKTGDGTYRFTGDLTIRGTTKPVALDVEATGPAKDPWGNQRWGFSVSGSIDREDFGLTWNQALETGGVLVGKKVDIHGEVQFIQS